MQPHVLCRAASALYTQLLCSNNLYLVNHDSPVAYLSSHGCGLIVHVGWSSDEQLTTSALHRTILVLSCLEVFKIVALRLTKGETMCRQRGVLKNRAILHPPSTDPPNEAGRVTRPDIAFFSMVNLETKRVRFQRTSRRS
jgi:hypothetical protein